MQNIVMMAAIALVVIIILSGIVCWLFVLFLKKIEGKGRDFVKKLFQ